MSESEHHGPGYLAHCDEKNCAWQDWYQTSEEAMNGLVGHCLKAHPDEAMSYPIVQVHAERVAHRIASGNGSMTHEGKTA
jgi:hypothetical protein